MAACVSLAICSSCSDEEVMKGSGQSDKLSFGVSISDKWETAPGTRSTAGETPERSAFKFDGSDLWLIATSEEGMDSTLFTKPGKAQTRAAEVTNTDFYDSFGVYAYVYEGDDWASGQNVKPYFTAEKVTKSNDNLWTTSPTKFWPGGQYRMQFFACAPHDITQKVTVNDNTPELAYTVPDGVKDQKDLIVATANVQGNHNSSVALKFQHILTAVKVKAAEGVSGTITKVALKGIKYEGTHVLGTSNWNVNETTTKGFELSCQVTLDPTIEGGTFIVDNDNTFMMIPQVLAENAELEITFSDGTVLTGSLSGKTDWEIGHTVIYKISKTGTEYILETFGPFAGASDIVTNDFTPSLQTTGYFHVKSYKYNNGVIEPVKWHVEYFDDESQGWKKFDNTRVSSIGDIDKYPYDSYYTDNSIPWFAIKSKTGTGGNSKDKIPVRIQNRNENYEWDKSDITETDLNELWLGDDIELGKITPYDLSTRSFYDDNITNVNTANCYVIKHRGTYMLPLIYGNAIKDGADNKVAYEGIDEINSPFIEDAETAELVWQDEPSLITDVELSTDTKPIAGKQVKYLVFSTTKDKNLIKQGNAVVAVKKGEEILWSWHIWITNDEAVTLFVDIENNEGNSYKLSSLNLGVCNAKRIKWGKREVKIRVVQDEEGGKNEEILFRQTPMAVNAEFNYTFYQWGRKDPIIGFTAPWKDIVGAKDKTKYNIRNEIIAPSFVRDNGNTQEFARQNPNIFIDNWSANKATYWSQTKTVYDPCPVGMRVPDVATFSGLTYNSGQQNAFTSVSESVAKDLRTGNVNTASLYYGQVRNDEHGYRIYCEKMNGINGWNPNSSTYFLPVYVVREPYNYKSGFMTHCMYYFLTNKEYIYIHPELINRDGSLANNYVGGTVRPVKDE